jgi:hypothetical protein
MAAGLALQCPLMGRWEEGSLMNRHHRVSFIHLKSDGSEWEITVDACPKHRASLTGHRIVREGPAPMNHCTFCQGRPYVGAVCLGSPWDRRGRRE